MHLETFASGHSVIHRLDPRVKIISTVLFSMVIALSDAWPVLIAGLVVAFILVLKTGLHLSQIFSRVALVNVFILFLWLFLPFSYPGRPFLNLGPLTASIEGIFYALTITVKSNTIILTIIALLSTSTIFSLVHALRHLYVPEKLVNLFFFTFRYFQVIHQEYLRLRAAMKVRCFKPRTSMHTYRSVAYLIGMLLVRGFDRSERVYQAMVCRGYQGRLWILDHFTLNNRDIIFLTIMTLVSILLAVCQWTKILG